MRGAYVQMSVCLRSHDNGEYDVAAAIGSPGIHHAAAVNRSRRAVTPEQAAKITAALAEVMGDEFAMPTPAEGDEADVR